MTSPRVSAPTLRKKGACGYGNASRSREGGRGSDGRPNEEIVAPPDAKFRRMENAFRRTKIIARSGTTDLFAEMSDSRVVNGSMRP